MAKLQKKIILSEYVILLSGLFIPTRTRNREGNNKEREREREMYNETKHYSQQQDTPSQRRCLLPGGA